MSENGPEDCMKLLSKVLDNEANDDLKDQFLEHIKICMPCYQRYHLDMAIKQLLKTKCGNKKAPADLIQSIRTQTSPPPAQ